MRIRIDLAYDGTDFRGWATQSDFRTVQEDLEAALMMVLRHKERIPTVCAGRTDAGVHARHQVVHADLPEGPGYSVSDAALAAGWPRLQRRLNGVLDQDARVHRVAAAPPGFDARFSANWRRYAYRVADAPELVDPLTRGTVLFWEKPLDLDAMNVAAKGLLGLQDFASFCRRREGATTIRSLLDLSWSRSEAGIAVADVRADAFCHSMVRSLVGCLLAVGDGRRDVDWPAEILADQVRPPTVAVAPALGLTLEEVHYPDDSEVAAQAERARRRRG